MENQNRRNFLKMGTALSVSAVATTVLSLKTSSTAASAAPSLPRSKNEARILGSGKQSIRVNYGMGLGCMGMSWNRTFIPDRKYMIQNIRKAYNMGVNLFDTAEAYGPFVNEQLVGEAVKSFRNEIILCSKFGFDIKNNKLTGGFNSRPEHIRQVVEQSLKRLQTDRIDLLYQHRVDPNVPMEDVADTVKDLIKEGKVKHFGLSEAGPENIRKAHTVQPLTAIQTEYSLMTRDPETDIFPVCEELGIGFVAYSPLSRAFLTGYINERTKYAPDNDNRGALPRYQPDAVKANWALIDVLKNFGDKRGLTVAQVSLAWLMAQKRWIVPIPGTTKLAHLAENLSAAEFQFTATELQELTQQVTSVKIVGARYATPQTR